MTEVQGFGQFREGQIVLISPTGEIVLCSFFGRAFSYVLAREDRDHWAMCSLSALLILGFEELGML